METRKFESILAIGENIATEFKRCSGKPEADTYETVCSFLNRFGGDLFLGVADDSTVLGVPDRAAQDIVKNIIKMVSNPETFTPTVYLAPEVMEYEGKTVVYVHVPPSSEVHSFKKVIYDRVDDADVKITATGQIAAMYIRKQSIFTEKKVYPYVKDEDLRFDLLPRVRQMAVNRHRGHPWENMGDTELLQSAGLIGENKETGAKGYNLAAVMLLGHDSTILSVAPQYRTDALLRKVNIDRYDDRLIVETNLIESYDLLMGFAAKHLLDKFYLDDDINVSLSSKISREMLVNCLMHREFTSSYIAQFVIEKDRMFTANANRAETGDMITPDNFRPNPKNPIIASFFRNIGLADELGSGVRNLYHYGKLYSGKEPQLIDGDVFRIIVPLDDSYSFDARIGKAADSSDSQTTPSDSQATLSNRKAAIIAYLHTEGKASAPEVAKHFRFSNSWARTILRQMAEEGALVKMGDNRYAYYVLKNQ
jgi:ATP-dependent DNA helicase RecG